MALAAQALLLPRVQDRAGGIASVLNRGEAQVRVGRVEIEKREIPMLGRDEYRHLPDSPQVQWQTAAAIGDAKSDEPLTGG